MAYLLFNAPIVWNYRRLGSPASLLMTGVRFCLRILLQKEIRRRVLLGNLGKTKDKLDSQSRGMRKFLTVPPGCPNP